MGWSSKWMGVYDPLVDSQGVPSWTATETPCQCKPETQRDAPNSAKRRFFRSELSDPPRATVQNSRQPPPSARKFGKTPERCGAPTCTTPTILLEPGA